MPRIKKKTPLTQTESLPGPPDFTDTLPPEGSPPTPDKQETKPEKTSCRRSPFLSIEEKRKWLACILRDTSGQHQGYELGLGDKFKALVEDNKLAGHPESEPAKPEGTTDKDSGKSLQNLLQSLLATVKPPHQQRFKDKP